ncbi:MAG: metal/formaldehyde-sensitive transcriptional repressor [Paludibacterium sp.]|uniref:metal/formaldehyde-sensitive transcriptional repressor n=1 Tax=Paludibacterium sp. TaxID=1917523 RepID=UPI0025EC2A13|nr:metal/formaldehyde-sensitive transcriptional repressor [Paludibacterium sp.]MBV8046935.1 metal/formaldehyde-sensitive transcriptional repressor [Paludibacterium sp.]MBV8646528.1 metal/formaldehyde-sensitive transcriptional repressor [Paludibacterium sp.]
MSHTIRDQAKLLARVRRLSGQTAALEKQLTNGTECSAVLQQIAAIRGAVNGLMAAVIEGHLSVHLVDQPDEAQRQKDLEVVLQVIKSYLK